MKRLLKYIRPFYLYIAVTMFIKFFGTVMELMIPSLLEIMLDDAVPAGDRAKILYIGGAMLLCYTDCLCWLLNFSAIPPCALFYLSF